MNEVQDILKSVKQVIAIAGMPGAGKAVASNAAKELDIPVFVCGDVLREEAKARKIAATPENFGDIMNYLSGDWRNIWILLVSLFHSCYAVHKRYSPLP